MSALPRRVRARVRLTAWPSTIERAQGAPDAQRTRGKACKGKRRRPPSSPAHPCANGLRLIRALPGAPGLLATVPPDLGVSGRRPTSPSRGLIPASGDRDHAISPSAPNAARRATSKRVHRIPPHVRDDAYVPLIGAGRCSLARFLIFGKKKFGLSAGRARTELIPLKKIAFWRRALAGLGEARRARQ